MGPGMSMGMGMQQRAEMKLYLAPRMIQSMEILQLPIMALQERIQQELQENPVLELRETTRLNTPATIGWLRPMLLLPADWRTWTEEERHAVLAHEIEHVRRKDFASWIAAQVGVDRVIAGPIVLLCKKLLTTIMRVPETKARSGFPVRAGSKSQRRAMESLFLNVGIA